MSPTITVNGLTLCHKGCGGTATSDLPDICMTPWGKFSIPINYINVAKAEDLVNGSETVKADGGNPIAIKGSKFSKSTGDEPGTDLGIFSFTQLDEAEFLTWSPDVTIEGKPVCRKTDKMFMNKRNSICLAGVDIDEVKSTPIDQVIELKENHVQITLVDDLDQPISNTKIELFDKDKQGVYQGRVDEDGTVVIDLSMYGEGTYYARYPELEPKSYETLNRKTRVIGQVYIEQKVDADEYLYSFKDNKLYYPIKIKDGDTIIELGAEKGYPDFFTQMAYFKSVNKDAPDACRACDDTAFETGKMFYLPLRPVVTNQVITHKIYKQTIGVRCIYDDESQEPLRNRHVLFWELNSEDRFYITKEGKYKKYGNVMDLPIGYGKTDEDGNLRSILTMKGCSDNNQENCVALHCFRYLKQRLAVPKDLVSAHVKSAAEKSQDYKVVESYEFYSSEDGSDTNRFEVGQIMQDMRETIYYFNGRSEKNIDIMTMGSHHNFNRIMPDDKRKLDTNDCHQLVPMQCKDKDGKDIVRFVWKENLSRFPSSRKLAFMVLPNECASRDFFITSNLLEIQDKYKTIIPALSSLQKQNPERSFFLPKGTYKNTEPVFFRTIEKKGGYFSPDGYYYSNKSEYKYYTRGYRSARSPEDAPYLKGYDKYPYIVNGYVDNLYLGGGYELIKERQADRVTIKIPCKEFLPEWIGRIRQKAEQLRARFNEYQEVVRPHKLSIAQLEIMKTYVTMAGQFPIRPYSDASPYKATYNTLEQFQAVINEEFVYNREKIKRRCKIPLENIERDAKDLFELLQNQGIKTAYNAYMEMVESDNFQGWPYKNTRINWLDSLFNELTKAYSILNAVENLVDIPIFKEHIALVFDLWALQLTSSDRKMVNDRDKYSKFRLEQHNDKPLTDLPVVYLMDKFLEQNNILKKYKEVDKVTNQISRLFSNSQGPTSFCHAIATLYHSYLLRDLDHAALTSVKGATAAGRAATRMFGYLKVIMTDSDYKVYALFVIDSINEQYPVRLKSDLNGRLHNIMKCSHDFYKGTNSTNAFNPFFAMFSLLSFAVNIGDREIDTLEKWVKLAESSLDSTVTCLGYILKKYSETKWYMAGGAVSKGVLNVIGVYLSVNAALESDYHGDYKKSGLHWLCAGASAIAATSFILDVVIASTAAGSLTLTSGGVLLVINSWAIVIAIGIGAIIFLIDVLTPATKKVFNRMKDNFGDKKGAYYNEYIHEKVKSDLTSTVKGKINKDGSLTIEKGGIDFDFESEYKKLGKDIDWSTSMSWRAVIPFFINGYVKYSKDNPKALDMKKTAETINDMAITTYGYYKKFKEEFDKKYKITRVHRAPVLEKDMEKFYKDLDRYYKRDKETIIDIITAYKQDQLELEKEQKKERPDEKRIEKLLAKVKEWQTGEIFPEKFPALSTGEEYV